MLARGSLRALVLDIIPLILLVAALVYALMSAAPPRGVVTYEVDLPRGGINEFWTVELGQVPSASAVTVDMALEVEAYLRYENRWILPWKPWAMLWSREQPEVWIGDQLVHREAYALWLTTIGVSPIFDGIDDFGGPSGTSATGGTTSITEPSSADPTPWIGDGVVTLEVRAMATDTGAGAPAFPYNLSAGVFVGGTLTVEIER